MGTRSALAIAAVLSIASLVAGCGQVPSTPASPPPLVTRPSVPPASLPAASIPTLEFVDPASVPRGVKLVVGSQLAAGTYRAFLTGAHVTSVAWTTGDPRAAGALEVQLDPEGTKTFADWTAAHVDQPVPLVVGGRVISVPVVREPIRSGYVEINASTSEAVGILKAAVVPAK